MSTILKALRRLEEDGSDEAKTSDSGLQADSDSTALEAQVPPVPSTEETLAYRQALSEPRSTDELRGRILAEERASEAVRPRSTRDESRARGAESAGVPTSGTTSSSQAAAATAPPPLDPFANRVVEPAFTPPSSATYGAPAVDSLSSADSVSASGAGAPGLFSKGMLFALLGSGAVAALLAGFFLSGSPPAPREEAEPVRADVPIARQTPPVQRTESAAPAAPTASAIANEAVRPAPPAPPSAPPAVPVEIASAESSVPTRNETNVSGAAVQPMTVARQEARVAPVAVAPSPSAIRAQKQVKEAPSALARAAVTPTRSAREASAEATAQPRSVDSVVAARPRPQRLSGERASVSAPAPAPRVASAAPQQALKTSQVKELPLAEIAPSPTPTPTPWTESTAAPTPEPLPVPRSAPSPEPVRTFAKAKVEPVRENVPRAGSTRPSATPQAQVRSAAPLTSSSAAASAASDAPKVDVVARRALPDLTVIRTSWHPAADRRSAKIRLEAKNELVTLREGDAVGEMVIREISPSAVVFSAGEVQIRRRVGEAGR